MKSEVKEDLAKSVSYPDVNKNEGWCCLQDMCLTFPPKVRQAYLALGPILITISFGMAEGYSAILLPQLENEGLMNTDKEMNSWIASITALSMPMGCILGGWLMEIIGRKAIHVITCIPTLIGWLLIYYSTATTLLLTGRFITGFCVGILGPVAGVYFAETTEPNFRGFLLATLNFAITFGLVFAHILGTYLTWQVVALISAAFPVLAIVTMMWAPESPTFLAKKRRFEDTKRAFYWCRGDDQKAQEELNELLKRQLLLSEEPKKSVIDQIHLLKKPEFFKPLLILLFFFFVMQWSGNNAMTFYSVDILKQTLGGGLDEYTAMIVIDVIRLAASATSCLLLKYMTRRGLMILSCSGTWISLLLLSLFTYLTRFYPHLPADYPAIPLVALITYMAFLTVGMVPLPWAMSGEVFPLASRGIGSGITSMVNYGLIFVVVKVTPWLFSNLGTDGTFLLFGVVCLVGMGVLMVFLPETKNKPLYEIEDFFKGNK